MPNSWDSYAGFLWHRASLLRLETHVLPIAVCKSCRIRHSPNSGTVRRFPVLPTPCAKTAKSCAFCDSLPVSSFASENSCFRNSHEQKLQNSAKPNSRTVCRFSPWYAFLPLIPAVWGFGLGLLGGQGFIGAKAPLDPLCRAFVAQSFAFAAFKKAGKFYF